ncbi:zinc-binding alcohol dehydrogenase family protein [Glaciihabitans sp. UYNi722]|uniref:quinone oxidoreductase family protein n=1 Tax=Glaciihabitans sp. UYNi722 TaxID=3156344 RepID=UPI003392AF51
MTIDTERTLLPPTMSAIVIRDFGGPDVMQLETVASPAVLPGEVVVRVGAVEVSRTRDGGTRSGKHPFSREVTLPHVLGGDFGGVIVAVGDGVAGSLVGARVAVMNHHVCGVCAACRSGNDNECAELEMIGIHRWGSYAEYTSVHADQVHRLPAGIDLAEAAALAATGPIGLTQLRTALAGPDSVILVTGMTGALASVVASLGSTLGATMIGLSRRASNAPRGGHIVLDSARPDLAEAILTASGGRKPTAVIDNVCAPDVFESYFPTLANGARIVVSGAIGTPEMPVLPVPARTLYSKSIALMGVRSHTVPITAEFWQLVLDGFRLPGYLIHEYPLERASATHQAILEGTSIGHTILRVSPEI